MRILIVEDSAIMRKLIARVLNAIELPNLTIEEAATGAEGLRACRASCPDLVLSDVHMPEFDGYSMVRKMREEGIDVPVGFITSDGGPQFRARAAEVGADFVLQKPFTEQALLDALADRQTPALEPIKSQLRYQTLRTALEQTTERVLGSRLDGAQRMLPRVPEKMAGAVISVVHAGDRTNVGLFGSSDTLSSIARRSQDEPDRDPSVEEIRDCLRELVNVIGGNVRSCFPEERTRLGLPEFIETAGDDPRTAGIAYELLLDSQPVVLLMQSSAPC